MRRHSSVLHAFPMGGRVHALPGVGDMQSADHPQEGTLLKSRLMTTVARARYSSHARRSSRGPPRPGQCEDGHALLMSPPSWLWLVHRVAIAGDSEHRGRAWSTWRGS